MAVVVALPHPDERHTGVDPRGQGGLLTGRAVVGHDNDVGVEVRTGGEQAPLPGVLDVAECEHPQPGHLEAQHEGKVVGLALVSRHRKRHRPIGRPQQLPAYRCARCGSRLAGGGPFRTQARVGQLGEYPALPLARCVVRAEQHTVHAAAGQGLERRARGRGPVAWRRRGL